MYVANRIGMILRHSNTDQWKHVRSSENAADVATRGCSIHDIPSSWLDGPEFLKYPQGEWREENIDLDIPDDDLEICPEKVSTAYNQVSVQEEVGSIDKLIE